MNQGQSTSQLPNHLQQRLTRRPDLDRLLMRKLLKLLRAISGLHATRAGARFPQTEIQMKEMWEERYGRDEYAYGEEPNAQLLYTVEDLREDFSDLQLIELEQVEAEIHEGPYHTGLASVVRLLARR